MTIENILFDLADALKYPVLILALVALVWVMIEAGALIAEVYRRRDRRTTNLENTAIATRNALAAGDVPGAVGIVRAMAFSHGMAETLTAIVELRTDPDARNRIAKRLADYDYSSMKRLERTRILVRMGPALGLMGTLIPLSPALAGLAEGNVEQLTNDLRVAFSVTVVGLLIGGVAFAISLIRERLYAQDFSDVEFMNVKLAQPLPAPPAHAVPLAHTGPSGLPPAGPAGAPSTAAAP